MGRSAGDGGVVRLADPHGIVPVAELLEALARDVRAGAPAATRVAVVLAWTDGGDTCTELRVGGAVRSREEAVGLLELAQIDLALSG